MSEELKGLLRAQAVEIAEEGHLGWSNTMVCAAAAIDERDARIADLEHRCGMYGLELTNEVERRIQATGKNKELRAELAAIKALVDTADGLLRSGRHLGQEGWQSCVEQFLIRRKLYAAPAAPAADAGLVEALEASNMLLRTKRHACENEQVCHVLDVHIKRNTAALAAHRAKGVV